MASFKGQRGSALAGALRPRGPGLAGGHFAQAPAGRVAEMRARAPRRRAAHLAAQEIERLAPPLAHCPRQARLDGGDVLIQVVAWSAEGGQAQQAQRARFQAARPDDRQAGPRSTRLRAWHATRASAVDFCTSCLFWGRHAASRGPSPYRQSPASRRSESRGPRPQSRTRASPVSASASATAWLLGMDSSKPSSPVYLQAGGQPGQWAWVRGWVPGGGRR